MKVAYRVVSAGDNAYALTMEKLQLTDGPDEEGRYGVRGRSSRMHESWLAPTASEALDLYRQRLRNKHARELLELAALEARVASSR